MELNVVATPVITNKKNNKKNKYQHNQNQRKAQKRPNEFSFTFNKTDKVKATVTGMKKQDGKKIVKKYLPSIKNTYGPKPVDKTNLGTNTTKISIDKELNTTKLPSSSLLNNNSDKQNVKKYLSPVKNASNTDKANTNKVQVDSNSPRKSYKNSLNNSNNEYSDPLNKSNKSKHVNQQPKVSSLFGHNPEVPTVGQRFVKPITENVFCGKEVSSLNIHPHSVKNIKDLLNITELTTVQGKTIPVLLQGRDALVRSQTGSGKTLAYGLPIVENLQNIRPKVNRNQGVLALIVVPTRELAIQTYEFFVKLLKPFTWIVPGYLIGGEKRKSEKARLRKGINILIGTPGRLCDHLIHTTHLKLASVKWLVLDEADRLLELGYERDVKEIVHTLANQKSSAWYDPLALLKEAAEKNASTHAGKSVHKKFSDVKNEQMPDTSGYDPLALLRQAAAKRVKSDTSKNDTEQSNDDDDEEVAKSDEDSDSDASSDDDSDAESSNDNKKGIKKHRGIIMFQGTQKCFGNDISENTQESSNLQETEIMSNNNLEQEKTKPNDSLQTVLLSATLTAAVENLAGLALCNPIFIETSEAKNIINDKSSKGKTSGSDEIMSIPASVTQSYILVPPKLRLVTLTGIIVNECRKKQNTKILVFVATQDLVDYHSTLMQKVLNEENDDSDSENEVGVTCDVTFFKLHGSMSQQDRTKVFKEFRAAKTGVLFCTDVAARGLDVPTVSLVIQYTPPTSVADYAHRVGRTARGGRTGRAIILLSPHEAEYVRALEDRRIRLSQDTLESNIEALLTPQSTNAQTAAIAMQQKYEEILLEDNNLMRMACKAFSSWTRFYSAFPGEWKPIFNIRTAHTGHYAKSLALREAPGSKNIRRDAQPTDLKERPQNRLTRERDPEELKKQKAHFSGGQIKVRAPKRGMSHQARQKQLILSEYDSGLPPLKKKKK